MAAFDWPGLMRAGLGDLQLRPDQFWALTPAELMLMIGMAGGSEALGRAGLDRLMAAHPDRTEDEG